MAPARVTLAPPERWSEERLLEAARALPDTLPPLEVGDAVGELLVVGVEPAEKAALEVVPRPPPKATGALDVAILVDCGASMAERWSAEHTRAHAARLAVESFLRERPARAALVELHAFDAALRRVAGVSELPDPRGKARAGSALQQLLAHLAAAPGERGRAILLVTDGPSETPRLLAAAERAGRLGIPIHVVVFAPSEDEALAEVARRSGGTIQRATLPPAIEFPEESS